MVIAVKIIYHFNRFHLAYTNDLVDAVGLMEGQLNWWKTPLKLEYFAKNQIENIRFYYPEFSCFRYT